LVDVADPAGKVEQRQARRTHTERRAVTRAALLDATVACLVEEGYAKTTTRRIAERAGVTPGALHHHFASKAELLGETRRHLTTRAGEELLSELPSTGLPLELRTELLLDRVWELYKGPLLRATLELLVGARTDSEVRKTGVPAVEHTSLWNEDAGPIMFPELAGTPGLTQLMETVQATMRGLALLTYGNDSDPDEVWPATRTHLLAIHRHFAEEAARQAASDQRDPEPR
jgi:AcrR family transcriptional regulator